MGKPQGFIFSNIFSTVHPGRTFLGNSIPFRSRSTSDKFKGCFLNGHFRVGAM